MSEALVFSVDERGTTIPVTSRVQHKDTGNGSYGFGYVVGYHNDEVPDQDWLKQFEPFHKPTRLEKKGVFSLCGLPMSMYKDATKEHIVRFEPTEEYPDGYIGFFDRDELEVIEVKELKVSMPPFSGASEDFVDLDLISNGKKLPLKSDYMTPFFKTKKFDAVLVGTSDKKTKAIGYYRRETKDQHLGCVFVDKDEEVYIIRSPLAVVSQFGAALELSEDGNTLTITETKSKQSFIYDFADGKWSLRS